MLREFAEYIVDSPLNQWVNSVSGLWPVLEIVHFIGLSLLLGGLIVVDLRLAGHFRSMDLRATHKLLPWVFAGFGLNLTSGVLFFYGDPLRYAINIGFQIKMLLVMIAGLNTVLYYRKVHTAVLALGAEADPPPLARVVAYTSLAAWTGVLLCGRLIPYVGTG